MTLLNKIDSNVTGLRWAEEASYNTLGASPIWHPLEPNTYPEFGGQLKLTARNPINPSRQRKKGVATGLDAGGGLSNDLTQSNLQELLQGFFFADLRRKAETVHNEVPITDVAAATDEYTLSNLQATVAVVAAGGAGYVEGDTITLTGGTASTDTVLTVLTVSGGAVLTASISTAGRYSAAPSSPVSQGSTSGVGTGATWTMTYAAVATLAAGDLIFGAGFSNAANNGLKRIASVTTANVVFVVDEALADETPATTAGLVKVGVQGTAGDLDVDIGGTFPTITSTTLDFTDLGLVPGEWIFVGGDTAALGFSNAANNGFKRVRSVAANVLTLDKSTSAMVTEASTTETVQLFIGRVLKNETGTDIVRRTYNLERTLGAPDDASPADIQSEYLTGSVPNEFAFNIPSEDKLSCDLNFTAADAEQRTAATGVKSGTRPDLTEADAFNTSSDVSRIKMSVVSSDDEAPTALFAYLMEATLNINNNVTGNKAVGTFGNFEATAGTFEVGGSLTAYFASVEAVTAVRNNSDITLDVILAKDNAGIALDFPMISLGDGRPNVEQDKPITLPLDMQASTGAKALSTMDHTLLMVFFDYLPTAAE